MTRQQAIDEAVKVWIPPHMRHRIVELVDKHNLTLDDIANLYSGTISRLRKEYADIMAERAA